MTDFRPSTSRELAEQYDAEAKNYRRYWAPVLHPISKLLVDQVSSRAAASVLDVGAGTGMLLPVLRNAYPEARVFAVDRSEGMIGQADRCECVAVADALALGFQDGVFDVALMNFMLFHLPDPVAGLREVRRVLARGGTVGATTWADDMAAPPMAIWDEELESHGAIPPEAIKRIAQHELMDSTEKTCKLFEAAGFDRVQSHVREYAYRMTLDDFVGLRQTVGSSRQRFESLDGQARTHLVASVRERLLQLDPGDFTFTIPIIMTVGINP